MEFYQKEIGRFKCFKARAEFTQLFHFIHFTVCACILFVVRNQVCNLIEYEQPEEYVQDN